MNLAAASSRGRPRAGQGMGGRPLLPHAAAALSTPGGRHTCFWARDPARLWSHDPDNPDVDPALGTSPHRAPACGAVDGVLSRPACRRQLGAQW